MATRRPWPSELYVPPPLSVVGRLAGSKVVLRVVPVPILIEALSGKAFTPLSAYLADPLVSRLFEPERSKTS
jgi:hypothetical protein